ncbi:hypothetical protein BGZ76_002622 [Entomortierella beljakovae]|nr:hypothetical protein BGZ76_002622 [Entomortierella beljakovae]
MCDKSEQNPLLFSLSGESILFTITMSDLQSIKARELDAAEIKNAENESIELYYIRWQKADQEDTGVSVQTPSQNILCYAVSQDGSYISALCEEGGGVFLKKWEFSEYDSAHNRPPHLLKKIDIAQSIPDESHTIVPSKLCMSLSLDGDQVSIMDTTIADPKSKSDPKSNAACNKFGLWVHNWNGNATADLFMKSRCLQKLKDVKMIKGYGKFHIPSSDNIKFDSKDELFVVCDGVTVDIYSVKGNWGIIQSIKLGSPVTSDISSMTAAARCLVKGLWSQYFPRTYHTTCNNEMILSLWNIKNESMISYINIHNPAQDGVPICFSTDGEIVAIVDGQTLRTHQTRTGSILGSYQMPCESINSIAFINDNSQIVVFSNGRRINNKVFQYGCILETASMVVLHWISCPENIIKNPIANSKGFMCFNPGAAMYYKKIEDFIILSSHNQPTPNIVSCPRHPCKDFLPRIPIQWSRLIKMPSEIEYMVTLEMQSLTAPPPMPLKASLLAARIPRLIQRTPTFVVDQNLQEESHEALHLVVSMKNSQQKFVIPPIFISSKVQDQYRGFLYIEACSSLVVISDTTIMIWNVPNEKNGSFNLHLLWTLNDDEILEYSILLCFHNQPCCQSKKKAGLQVSSASKSNIASTGELIPLKESAEKPYKAYYPHVNKAANKEYKDEFKRGILTLSKMFKGVNNSFKEAALRYFGTHIYNPCLLELFSQDLLPGWEPFVELASAYLQSPTTKWVPPVALNPKLNLIIVAVKDTVTVPKKIGAVEKMIDQLIERGRAERDPHIVTTVTQCIASLNRGINPHTNLMKRTLRKLAFFPVKNPQFVLDNYVIVVPPGIDWRRLFWRDKMEIKVADNPTLQLSFGSETRQAQYLGHLVSLIMLIFIFIYFILQIPVAAIFQQNQLREILGATMGCCYYLMVIFVLTPIVLSLAMIFIPVITMLSIIFSKPTWIQYSWNFLMLYFEYLQQISGNTLFIFSSGTSEKKDKPFIPGLYVATFEMLWINYRKESCSPLPVTPAEFKYPPLTFWFRFLIDLFIYEIIPFRATVKSHKFTTDMLDNPAISALVEYKWLVLVIERRGDLETVFEQVYNDDQSFLRAIFYIIAIMSGVFLWLEVKQVIWNWKRYLSSPYNVIDVLTFTLAMTGSIYQLKSGEHERGKPGILSFTVIFAALQFMFELRISRGVCKFVTIIIKIINRIRVFFLIAFGGILAFSTAILHLLKSQPRGTDVLDKSDFPTHFYRAVTTTFFFTAGRYDPISSLFNDRNDIPRDLEEDWMFLTMINFNFIFTGIIILNVLIALINVGFSRGDGTWQQVWLENKLFIIEAAENMTYHISDFRKYYGCFFPREIYYTVKDRDTKSKYDNETNDLIQEAKTYLDDWLKTSTNPTYQPPHIIENKQSNKTIQDLQEKNKMLETKLEEMQTNMYVLRTDISCLNTQITDMLEILKSRI